MLFIKYISDIWKDHYEQYKKQYGDDEVRIRRKLDRERFVIRDITIKEERTVDVFPATFYSLYDRRNEPNIGELINMVLESIEEANKSKLEDVFRNIDFNSEGKIGRAHV